MAFLGFQAHLLVSFLKLSIFSDFWPAPKSNSRSCCKGKMLNVNFEPGSLLFIFQSSLKQPVLQMRRLRLKKKVEELGFEPMN